jgi:hypothetical protein
MVTGNAVITTSRVEHPRFRLYGNTAVLISDYVQGGTNATNKPFEYRYVTTDIWILRGGRWECVSTQLALVPKKS